MVDLSCPFVRRRIFHSRSRDSMRPRWPAAPKLSKRPPNIHLRPAYRSLSHRVRLHHVAPLLAHGPPTTHRASLTRQARRSVTLGSDWRLEDRVVPATTLAGPTHAGAGVNGPGDGRRHPAFVARRPRHRHRGLGRGVGTRPEAGPTRCSLGANVTPTGLIPNAYIAEFGAAKDVATFGPQLAGQVAFAYPLVALNIAPRLVPNDNLFPNQWHLRNTGQTGGSFGADVTWSGPGTLVTGTGVVIGVVDDGLEHTHPDLQPNYRAVDSFDFVGNDSNPAPPAGWGHGTAVGGVAAARGNNNVWRRRRCVHGIPRRPPVAHRCERFRRLPRPRHSPITATPSTFTTTAGARSTTARSEHWTARAGSDQAGLRVRPRWLGNIYHLGGGGNGRSVIDDNVNYDAYASSRFVIAVGAIDHNGRQVQRTANPARSLLVSAYSSSRQEPGITTTDLTGRWYSWRTDFRRHLVGHAARVRRDCPDAAGQPGPDGPRRPKHPRANRARTTPLDPGWSTNKAGFHINHKYGFGAINAAGRREPGEELEPRPSAKTVRLPAHDGQQDDPGQQRRAAATSSYHRVEQCAVGTR